MVTKTVPIEVYHLKEKHIAMNQIWIILKKEEFLVFGNICFNRISRSVTASVQRFLQFFEDLIQLIRSKKKFPLFYSYKFYLCQK